MSNRYTSFAHEIASLQRKQQRQKEDESTMASGICCAACGLECSVSPDERTTCQKCYSVHYCTVECRNWHWQNEHSLECSKKPSFKPKALKMLKFQKKEDDTLSTRSGVCCNACGLECRVAGEERTTCPECGEVSYCNDDCKEWDWTNGGHSEACSKKLPKKMAFTDFHKTLELKLQEQQQPKQQSAPPKQPPKPQQKLAVTAFTKQLEQKLQLQQQQQPPTQTQQQRKEAAPQPQQEETVSEYTYEEVTVEDSEGKSKSKDSAESRDDDNEDKQGEDQYFDDIAHDEDYNMQSERFLDDIPEGSDEDTSFDLETLQINRFGSAMAAHGAPYRSLTSTPESGRGRYNYSRSNTPDTPETRVTSNRGQTAAFSNALDLDDQQQQPSPSRSFLGRASRSKIRQSDYDQALQDYRDEQEPSPQRTPRGQLRGRRRPQPTMPHQNEHVPHQREQQQRQMQQSQAHEHPEDLQDEWAGLPDQPRQQRLSQRQQQAHRVPQQQRRQRQQQQQQQHQSRGYVAPEAYPALLAPAVPIESSQEFHDVEVGTQDNHVFVQNNNGHHDSEGYEFMSAASSGRNRKSRSRLTVLLAVILSCSIGIIIAVGAVSGLVWFGPGFLGGDDDGDNDISNRSDNNTTAAPSSSPTTLTAPTPVPPPLEMNLQQDFPSSTDGYGISVALSGSLMAIASSEGTVDTFVQNQNGNVVAIQELTEPVENSAFGSQVSIVDDDENQFLIVGAPGGGDAGSGEVYVFAYRSLYYVWEELSVSATGLSGLNDNRRLAETEEFGFSVAMSKNLVLVAGAPGSDAGKGSVHIYTFNKSGSSFDLIPASVNTLRGEESGSRFGSAVAISESGTVIGIGSPAGQKFHIFEWDGAAWNEALELHYPQEVDLGSSVSFLSNSYVAVGAPSADSNRGVVHICEKQGIQWVEVKTITGSWGDRLGSFQTIGGSEGSSGPELVVATASGSVQRYDLINEEWVQRFSFRRSSAGASSVAVSENDGNFDVLVGRGSAKTAALFTSDPSGNSVVTPLPTPSPTPKPTPAPLPPGETAPPTNGPEPTKSPLPPGVTSSPTTSPVSDSPTYPPTPSPTPQPTPLSTSSPTTEPGWVLMAGPYTSTNSLDGFGTSVAVAGSFMVAAEPLVSHDVGQVHLYEKGALWAASNRVFDTETLKFGSAVDLAVVNGEGSLLVGAKETKAGGTRFGSAAYYKIVGGSFSQVGSTLKPFAGVIEAGGEFGGAVAMASTRQRIAVSAPDSSWNMSSIDTGRIYTYDFDGTDWQQMTSDPIIGHPGSMLGSAIDMSMDGSRLLAGSGEASNGAGNVFYYEYKEDTSSWKSIFPLPGGSGEGLGTSVSILDDAGATIAFGGPGYGNDQGVIRVYQESGGSGFFLRMGGDIVGAEGDRIGKTLSGAQNRMAFGTDNGSFHVMEYKSNQWKEVARGAALGSPVVSLSLSEDAETVVVGLANEQVRVYQLW